MYNNMSRHAAVPSIICQYLSLSKRSDSAISIFQSNVYDINPFTVAIYNSTDLNNTHQYQNKDVIIAVITILSHIKSYLILLGLTYSTKSASNKELLKDGDLIWHDNSAELVRTHILPVTTDFPALSFVRVCRQIEITNANKFGLGYMLIWLTSLTRSLALTFGIPKLCKRNDKYGADIFHEL